MNDQPFKEVHTLDVGDGHTLYVEDWGNRDAKYPVIFLHGGPGGGVKDRHKRVFDQTRNRVIFFDQRGCGRSTPYGSIENNTTDDLEQDITRIADYFGLDKFVLHGSSWGSALSLIYALRHPDRVHSVVVGGVFTGSRFEMDWIDQGSFKTFRPDVWQTFLDSTPTEHRDDPTKFHFDKAVNGTPEEQLASVYAYDCLESAVATLDDRFTPEVIEDFDPAPSKIEMHYLLNDCFIPERYVLDNASNLTMPIHIVQGRYDMVCPPVTAYELSKTAPSAKLYWTLAGHKLEHESENIFRSIFAALEDGIA